MLSDLSFYLLSALGISAFLWTALEHKSLSVIKLYFRFILTAFLFLYIGKLLTKSGFTFEAKFYLLGINMMIYLLLFQKIFSFIYLKIYKAEPTLDKYENPVYTLSLFICAWISSIFFGI